MEDYKIILKNVLALNNIEYTDEMDKKFEIYFNFLVEYNKITNLTAIVEKNEVYIKHFADSSLCANMFNFGSTICDIGTGAGFPGMVLKIIRPDLKITLVDSLQKRVDFLNKLALKLNFNDITILHNRAEDDNFKKIYLNSFDYVVARAVAKLNTLCEYCLPFVNIGGHFVSYKSGNVEDELNDSKTAIKVLGGSIEKIIDMNLDDMERKFVVIKKVANSSNKYPRNMNKPKLKPL